jgi:tight adherence protein B
MVPIPVILALVALTASLGIFAFYGVKIMSRKWEASQKKSAEKTASQFEQMFLFIRKKILVRLYIAIPVILGTITYFTTKKWWLCGLFAILGLFLPPFVVRVMDKRRRKKFVYQLIDGLMIMNSCLKGGLTLIQSFEVLAEETNPPMSQEISLLNREVKVGVTLEEALTRLGKRMPSEEMVLVSSAILVARETGGDLTKVFSRLIETIRDRLKLKELVATLTLQARLQSIIISLLGPAFFFIVRKIKPDHFDIMWQDELGRWILLYALISQIIGFVLIIIFGKVEI